MLFAFEILITSKVLALKVVFLVWINFQVLLLTCDRASMLQVNFTAELGSLLMTFL